MKKHRETVRTKLSWWIAEQGAMWHSFLLSLRIFFHSFQGFPKAAGFSSLLPYERTSEPPPAFAHGVPLPLVFCVLWPGLSLVLCPKMIWGVEARVAISKWPCVLLVGIFGASDRIFLDRSLSSGVLRSEDSGILWKGCVCSSAKQCVPFFYRFFYLHCVPLNLNLYKRSSDNINKAICSSKMA